jgi:hypothetical protein
MRQCQAFWVASIAAGVVVVAAAWQAPQVAAQTSARAAEVNAAAGWSVPRTPWGDPDLQGTWTTDDTIGVPVERNAELGDKLFLTDEDLAARARAAEERRAAAAAAAVASGNRPAPVGPPDHWGESASQPVRQTSFVVDPPDGRIPTVTSDAQRRAAGRDRGSFGTGPFERPEDLTNFDRCISRGVVGSLLPRPYGNGLDIVQAPGVVAISHEMIHEPRIIRLTGGSPVSQRIRQYMGDARGRWEGDTLVVVTTNFTDKTSIGFNGNGLRHSAAMRLTERFTRADADTIQWDVTIEDPETYTTPFTIATPIRRQNDYQVFEYACHEGNYGIRNILSGARADEGN